jgi:hypothetical protein
MEKLTTERIRKALSAYISTDASTICSIIRTVTPTEDPDFPSIGITRDGDVTYNVEFIQKHLKSDRDVAALCMHEIFHPMFKLFYGPMDELGHFAMDATINATIHAMFGPNLSGFFDDMYKSQDKKNTLTNILHPKSSANITKFKQLHHSMYGNSNYDWPPSGKMKIQSSEILSTLRILINQQKISVILLGSHGNQGKSGGKDGNGSNDQKDGKNPQDKKTIVIKPKPMTCDEQKDSSKGAAADNARNKLLKDIIKDASSNGAGFSDELKTMLSKILENTKSPRMRIFEKYAVVQQFGKFLTKTTEQRVRLSPIPISPCRRDLIMLALNKPVIYFRNEATNEVEKETSTVRCYLDVSGSFWDDLPKVLGILKSVQAGVQVFQFSNRVAEVSVQDTLQKGKLLSTWGTDLNCVADHMLKDPIEKAIIFTDGYCSMSNKLFDKVKDLKMSLMTIFSNKSQTNEQLSRLGETMILKDLLED